MFKFLKKKNNMSKVRAWAEAQKKVNQKGKPIKILSDAIIYGLSKFCSSEEHGKKRKDLIERVSKKVRLGYSSDASLFEIGCYLYFRIDLWHVQNNKREYRETVVSYLIDQFLSVFKDTLNLENIEEILQNRLNLYGKLVRESKNREELQNEIDFYLTQLVIRTADNTSPKIYDFIEDFPVVIVDVFEKIFLEIEIKSFEHTMIPACLKNIENFYKLTSEENK
jgi:hypothetical protein